MLIDQRCFPKSNRNTHVYWPILHSS